MKSLLFTSAIAASLFFVVASFSKTEKKQQVKNEETAIQFIDDWGLAVELAKKEKKLIYLDAMASWCGPCKLMDKRTFSDPAVAKFYNKNFINVKLDMEKSPNGPELMTKYEVVAYPTSLFIDHKGELVKKELGYMDAEKFLQLGESVAKK